MDSAIIIWELKFDDNQKLIDLIFKKKISSIANLSILNAEFENT